MQRRWIGVLAVLLVAMLCSPAIAKRGGGKPGGGGGGGGVPPADPAIAYVQEEGGSWNLKVMNADGTNQTVLVPGAGFWSDPSWSPDGTELVFESDALPAGRGLYVVPADGTAQPTLLVSTLNVMNGVSWSPTAAPDGKHKIAWIDTVSYSNRYDIYVINTDGTGLQNLTAWMPRGEQLGHQDLAWSRDGTRLVSCRGYVPAGSTEIQRALVEYTLAVGQGGVLEIQGERNLLQGALSGARVYSPSYGRVGDTVLVSVYEYVNNRDNRDVWEIDLVALGSPTRLTNTTDPVTNNRTLQERHPDYGPDDTRIVYRALGKGNRDGGIFVQDTVPGATAVKLIASGSVKDPTWRRQP